MHFSVFNKWYEKFTEKGYGKKLIFFGTLSGDSGFYPQMDFTPCDKFDPRKRSWFLDIIQEQTKYQVLFANGTQPEYHFIGHLPVADAVNVIIEEMLFL